MVWMRVGRPAVDLRRFFLHAASSVLAGIFPMPVSVAVLRELFSRRRSRGAVVMHGWSHGTVCGGVRTAHHARFPSAAATRRFGDAHVSRCRGRGIGAHPWPGATVWDQGVAWIA